MPPHISVITSLFRAEAHVEEFYERCLASITKLTDSYEFVFVDDGSPDGSGRAVRDLIERDKSVRLVELSRNFGQHKALMAGLEVVQGDLVFLLDSDLEEPPELLEEFYRAMHESPDEIDVVYGYMEERKGGVAERAFGWLFYSLINVMSEIHIPESALAARLMTIGYVRNLVSYREMHVFLGGVFMLTGYRQIGVPATKTSKGKSTYNFGLRLTIAIDALLSFTNKPLTYVAALGLTMSSISFAVALLVFVTHKSSTEAIWLVLASLWFLGGLIISSIGLVGMYVGRIFLQVKGRPNVVVKNIYN